jgi:hypothetical protein
MISGSAIVRMAMIFAHLMVELLYAICGDIDTDNAVGLGFNHSPY